MLNLQAKLTALSRHEGAPALSLYIPMPEPGTDGAKSRIVLENEQAHLRARLEGLDRREREALLSPLDALHEPLQTPGRGAVAGFRSHDTFEIARTHVPVEATAEVAPRFHLAPLVAEKARQAELLVLALTLDNVRLYRADRDGLAPIEFSSRVPRSLTEARGHDVERPSIQHHSTGSAGLAARLYGAGREGRAGTFHTQGGGRDDRTDEIEAFFGRLDAALREEALPDLPILLAGVDEEVAHFRKLSDHARLVDDHVALSPDGCTDAELHAAVVRHLDRRIDRRSREAWQRVVEPRDARCVSTDLEDIVRAGAQGQLDTVFVRAGARRPGRFEPASLTTQPDPEGPEDLVNLAVCLALRHGGDALPIVDPSGPDIAATKRFA